MLALFGAACTSPSPSPIVGTWLLGSVVAVSSDGSVDTRPYGESPAGYLTYTAQGRMQVILSFGGRDPLCADWRASPVEERAKAFATSLSYAGRYSYSPTRVVHHVEVSSDPNRVGTSIERKVQLTDDGLILTTPPTAVGGSSREFTLTWYRAPATSAPDTPR